MTPERSKVNPQLTRTDFICLLDENNLYLITFQLLNILRYIMSLNCKQDVTVVWLWWEVFGCHFSLFAFPLNFLHHYKFTFRVVIDVKPVVTLKNKNLFDSLKIVNRCY